jgi:hypothetical protein
MRKYISLLMVLLPCTAFASSDCSTVEYADHYEVVCVGAAEQPPAVQKGQEQTPVEEQTAASARTAASQQQEVLPEQIERSNLAILHGAAWLKTQPHQ